MNFGKVLTRAWEIIWKHKVLWFFGILASCGSQGGGGGGSTGYTFDSNSFQGTGNIPPEWRRFFFELERIPSESIFAIVIALIFVALFLALVFFLLSVFGRMSVIKGALQAEGGKALTFRQLSADGFSFFWRGLGLALMNAVILITFVFIFVFLGVAFTTLTLGLGLLCLIPLICILVPLGILYGVFIEMANVALVVEDVDVFEALQHSWALLRQNFANVAVMALILLIGGGVLSFLIALPIILVALPTLLAFLIGSSEAIWGGLAISGVLLLIGIPFVILLSGMLRSYILSAWTLTYIELSAPKAKVKKIKA